MVMMIVPHIDWDLALRAAQLVVSAIGVLGGFGLYRWVRRRRRKQAIS